MTTQFMRTMDRWMGALLCLLLTWFHLTLKVLFRRNRVPAVENVNHIVLAKFFGMGSIVLSAQMIRSLKQSIPNSKLTYITFRSNSSLVELLDGIDGCRALRTESILSFTWDVMRLVVWMRWARTDVFLDLEFLSKFSVVMSYLSGARIRIGFLSREVWRRSLLTHPIYINRRKHITEHFCSMLRPLGIKNDFDKYPVFKRLPPIDGLNLPKLPLAVVNPNTSDLMDANMRRWPLDRFTRLCEKVLDNSDFSLVLVGSSADLHNCEYVHSNLPRALQPRVTNICGKTSILELCHVFRQAEFIITNDSGPMHIATALDIPVVAFFGAETPSLYGPCGHGHLVFHSDVFCSPCVNVYNLKEMECFNPSRYECLRSIGVTEVFDAMRKRFPHQFSRQELAAS